jgi:GNAT superfamily N-acetyltransferase
MTVDPSGCVIRPAISTDVPRLIELLRLGALVADKEDPSKYADYEAALDEINTGPGCVLVAELDGDVVGLLQIIVFRHFQEQGRKCAELESIHVHPDYRSHGIGHVLMTAAEEYARKAGCYRLQLTSNKARTDAHHFYDHHGYEATHIGYKKRF